MVGISCWLNLEKYFNALQMQLLQKYEQPVASIKQGRCSLCLKQLNSLKNYGVVFFPSRQKNFQGLLFQTNIISKIPQKEFSYMLYIDKLQTYTTPCHPHSIITEYYNSTVVRRASP